MQKIITQKLLPLLLVIGLLVSINLFFFRSELSGKKLYSPDEISYISSTSEKSKEPHIQSFWTNSLFSGMPTYQIDRLPLSPNPFQYIQKALSLFTKPMMSHLIAIGLIGFICLLIIGLNPYLAAIGAFAYSFTSGHFVLVAATHHTKLEALAFLPMIWIGFYFLFSRQIWVGFLLFTIGLLINIQVNHIQMTYYIMIGIIVYYLILIIQSLRLKNIRSLIRPTLLTIVGVFVVILGNIAHLSTMYDYAKETTRGNKILTAPLTNETAVPVVIPAEGLDWKYASEYSNGYLDLMSMIVPGFVGGSMNEKISTTSALADDFRKKNKKVSNPFFAPLYWGSLPSSSGPDYLGIISFVLFCIGLSYIQSPIKYWAVVSFGIMVILSLGHNFFINKYLFSVLPFYNKFRSLNSILHVAAVIVPLFGIYTLDQLLKNNWKEQQLKRLLKMAVWPIFGFIALITVVGSMTFTFSNPIDKSFWSNVQALEETRLIYMIKSSFRTILIGILFVGVLYFTLLNRLKKKYFYILTAILFVWDLVPIARKCLPEKEYITQKSYSENLSLSAGDLEISRDRDMHFRVLDQANNTFNNSYASLNHKSIGGYHPAKLQRYQDLIDGYLNKGKSEVINMLNTKYIISANGQVNKNEAALGNAWFVDTILKANSPNEEFAALKNLNVKSQAVYLENEFPGYFIQTKMNPNGFINLTKYRSNELTYKYNTTSPQLAVFSEIWYSDGWQAYIDGNEVPHIRVNYVLRALKLPEGAHEIVFKFQPQKVLSLLRFNKIILWVFFAGFLLMTGYLVRQRLPAISNP